MLNKSIKVLQLQDVNAAKYTLSVQGHNDPQNSPLIMTVEKLMKQLSGRLSAVERDVKTIKDAINNVSLEEKLGRAIENIENKLDKLSDFIYSQTEPVYYASMEVRMVIAYITMQLLILAI